MCFLKPLYDSLCGRFNLLTYKGLVSYWFHKGGSPGSPHGATDTLANISSHLTTIMCSGDIALC